MESKAWKAPKTDTKQHLRLAIGAAVFLLTAVFAIVYAVLQSAHGAYHSCSSCLGVGTVLGVILGFVFIIALFAGTMYLYYHSRQKHAYSKYFVEVRYMAIVLIICVAIKMITSLCIYLQAGGDGSKPIEEGISTVLMSFYESIGVLTFNGINEISEIWARIIYFGASMYAGLMFLGIISAKASYEGFSYVQMRFCSEKHADVYVFTALTDETLQLAISIKNNSIERNKDLKCFFNKHKVRIVFAGPSLEPFDRHNDLCREVMANGFLYWSYADREKSISKVLHLNNCNVHDYSKHFAVFAFEAKNHIPEEENNMDAVFDDIKRRIKEANDSLRIEYYILTKREINYQAYDCKMKELKAEYGKKIAVEKDLDDEFYSKFVVEVWNEANAVAKHAVDKVMEAGLRNVLTANMFGNDSVAFKNNLYAWSLGFGGTAEAIMRELFIQSPSINANGYSRKFYAEVFDKYASKPSNQTGVDGIFKFSHPSYMFINPSDTVVQIDRVKEAYLNRMLNKPSFYLTRFGGIVREHSIEVLMQEIADLVAETEKQKEDLFAIDAQLLEAKAQKDKEEIIKELENRQDEILCELRICEEKIIDDFDKKAMYELYVTIGDDDKFKELIDDAIYNVLSDQPMMIDEKVINEVGKKMSDTLSLLKGGVNVGKDLDRWLYRVLECGLPHPVYNFNAVDCLGLDFLKHAENLTAYNRSFVKVPCPDVVIVATGDDYQNIRLANALIHDIASKKTKDDFKQFIVVNVFDSRNNDLIGAYGGQWDDVHKQLVLGGLTVIVVGNYEDTYCIDGIQGETLAAANKNYTYETASKKLKNEYKDLNNIIREQSLNPNTEYDLKGLNEAIAAFKCEVNKMLAAEVKRLNELSRKRKQQPKGDNDVAKCMLEYDKLTLWKKQSNKSVVEVTKLYKAIYDKYKKTYDKIGADKQQANFALYVASVEHDRWIRQHMSDGWTYRSQRNDAIKKHPCMIDFFQVDKSMLVYDFLNAVWAISEE